MEITSHLPRARPSSAFLSAFDLQRVSIWALGFGLTVYLGLNGGGFDPLIGDQVGIVIWWIVIAGLLVGAFPRRSPGALGWASLGLLAAFVAWTALSLGWTDSHDRTSADLARICGYLAVFALVLFARGSRSGRLLVASVGTAIAFLSVIALLSRLHPAWFPEADQTARFLGGAQGRLAYPLNYWNAVAAMIAIGLPLMLNSATSGKSAVLRSLSAAAIPAMVLAIFFTLSRGGIAAAAIALAVYLIFCPDRLPRLVTMAIAGAGSALLIGATTQRHDLQEGFLGAAARHQGNEVLAMTIVICVGVGLLQAAISLGLLNGTRPAWTVPSRGVTFAGLGVAVVVVLVAADALNAPHRVSHAWDQFKGNEVQSGTSRLSSFGGENRDKFWSSAIEEFESKPLTGTGSGTFQYWWDQNGNGSVVRDTHSLYFQTLGELGLVGIALLAGFMVVLFVGGGREVVRASPRGRPQLAAAYAGCVAFFVTAIFDWTWQIPVLPMAMLLLAAPLVTAGVRSRRRRRAQKKPWAPRLALLVVAFVGIVAIAIPLSSTSLLRESQAQAREGDIPAALESASSAHNAQPDAALPHLQQALLLEEQGSYSAGVAQARAATHSEPDNWRNWLVLTRLEVESGHPRAAVHAYRRASSLDPHNSIFNR